MSLVVFSPLADTEITPFATLAWCVCHVLGEMCNLSGVMIDVSGVRCNV